MYLLILLVLPRKDLGISIAIAARASTNSEQPFLIRHRRLRPPPTQPLPAAQMQILSLQRWLRIGPVSFISMQNDTNSLQFIVSIAKAASPSSSSAA